MGRKVAPRKRNRFDRGGCDPERASSRFLRNSSLVAPYPLSFIPYPHRTVACYYIHYRHRLPPPAFSSPSLLFRLLLLASVFLLISYRPIVVFCRLPVLPSFSRRATPAPPSILSSFFPFFFFSSPRAPCILPSFNYLHADW